MKPVCPGILSLQEYVDGQLPSPRLAELRQHLTDCPRCRAIISGLTAVVTPLRSPDLTAQTPADLRYRIMAAVAGAEALPTLTCAEARERIELLADGALDHVAAQELEAHLGCCAECARERREVALIVGELRAVEAESAPAGLLERLLSDAPRRRPAPARWRWVASAGGLAAAAALMVALLLRGPAPVPMTGPQVAVAPPAIERPAMTPSRPADQARPATETITPLPGRTPAPPVATGPAPRLATVADGRPPRDRSTGAPPAGVGYVPAAVLTAPSAPDSSVLGQLPVVSSGPVAVALGPIQPERTVSSPRPIPATEPPSTAASPVVPARTSPTATRLASLPTAKAAPHSDPSPAETEQPLRVFVARAPEAEENVVYSSEDRSTRLELARAELSREVRRMADSREQGWD